MAISSLGPNTYAVLTRLGRASSVERVRVGFLDMAVLLPPPTSDPPVSAPKLGTCNMKPTFRVFLETEDEMGFLLGHKPLCVLGGHDRRPSVASSDGVVHQDCIQKCSALAKASDG